MPSFCFTSEQQRRGSWWLDSRSGSPPPRLSAIVNQRRALRVGLVTAGVDADGDDGSPMAHLQSDVLLKMVERWGYRAQLT